MVFERGYQRKIPFNLSQTFFTPELFFALRGEGLGLGLGVGVGLGVGSTVGVGEGVDVFEFAAKLERLPFSPRHHCTAKTADPKIARITIIAAIASCDRFAFGELNGTSRRSN